MSTPYFVNLSQSGGTMSTRQQLANAIRFLSMDAVQKAKSGHPGAPMGHGGYRRSLMA